MHAGVRGKKERAKFVRPLLGAGLLLAAEGVAWASGGGGEHGGGHLNWSDFLARTLVFVITFSILFKLLKKPIAGFFSSRKAEIQRLLSELELKQKEAEQNHAECKAKLAALEVETKKIVDELIAEGEVERQKIIEAAEKQADYLRQQADVAIQQEIKAAREKLKLEISELSVAAAEEILRKNMKAKDQDRLVRDFMKRVVEAK